MIKKNIWNIDVIVHKLKPALIKAINQKLKVVRKEMQKKEKMIEKQKVEVIVTKEHKTRKKIITKGILFVLKFSTNYNYFQYIFSIF